MLIQPIGIFTACLVYPRRSSTAYVAWDQYRNNPEPAVMKWGFILVTLYMGPIGLLLYVLADKEPRPGEHQTFVKPLWQHGVGSTIHSVAGDARRRYWNHSGGGCHGDAGAAHVGRADVEYVTGFAIGLFIFQSAVYEVDDGRDVLAKRWEEFHNEFISMNFMMAGIAPVMSSLIMHPDMRATEPAELLF